MVAVDLSRCMQTGLARRIPLMYGVLARGALRHRVGHASPKNPKLVQRFQVILAGSEVGKGYSELNDPIDQAERFVEQQRKKVRKLLPLLLYQLIFFFFLFFHYPWIALAALENHL